jgi:hypothetical protein
MNKEYQYSKAIQCQKNGCNHEATKSISLEIRVDNRREPATSSDYLFLCDEHAKECTFEEVVTDEGWESICGAFLSNGYVRPNKEFCNIIIRQYRVK